MTTALVALVMISGGFFQVIKQTGAVEGITRLGYPAYVVTILGVWKLLGGVALLAPRTPRLKEWAYAGIVFDLTGAALSHAASDTGAGHIAWPLGIAALAVVSWALRPQSRVVGTLLPSKSAADASTHGHSGARPESAPRAVA